MTSSQNVRQLQVRLDAEQQHEVAAAAGSVPAENASAGHLIVATTPSTSSTVGRAAWKSRYSSVSSVANGAGADGAGEPAHRVGRRVGRVVPARERGDERGPPQRRLAFQRTVTRSP